MKNYKDENDNLYGLADHIVPPDNYVLITVEERDVIIEANKPPLTVDDYAESVQVTLDAQAKSMGYDSIFTAISYEGDSFQKFNDDAVSLKEWRSLMWQVAYSTLAQVESGDTAQPTIEEFLDNLPDYV